MFGTESNTTLVLHTRNHPEWAVKHPKNWCLVVCTLGSAGLKGLM